MNRKGARVEIESVVRKNLLENDITFRNYGYFENNSNPALLAWVPLIPTRTPPRGPAPDPAGPSPNPFSPGRGHPTFPPTGPAPDPAGPSPDPFSPGGGRPTFPPTGPAPDPAGPSPDPFSPGGVLPTFPPTGPSPDPAGPIPTRLPHVSWHPLIRKIEPTPSIVPDLGDKDKLPPRGPAKLSEPIYMGNPF